MPRLDLPDAPSVNLPDLLFETVQSVSYAEAPPYQSSVGGILSLTPTVLTSTGIAITDMSDTNLLWSLSDPTVATFLDAWRNGGFPSFEAMLSDTREYETSQIPIHRGTCV